jgi:hypothetical protein
MHLYVNTNIVTGFCLRFILTLILSAKILGVIIFNILLTDNLTYANMMSYREESNEHL